MRKKSICSMLIVILLFQLIIPVVSSIRVLAVETNNSVLIEVYNISATTSDNVTASLYKVDGNYTLIISGTGNMKNFAKASDVPWSSYCGPYSSKLTKVVIRLLHNMG